MVTDKHSCVMCYVARGHTWNGELALSCFPAKPKYNAEEISKKNCELLIYGDAQHITKPATTATPYIAQDIAFSLTKCV